MLNIDTASLGFATDWFRPALMQRPHRHNEVEINYLEAGSLTYLFGGTRTRVLAGQLALFWATIPHQVVHVEAATILHWFTIPFATFLRWQLPDLLTQRVIRGNFALGDPQGAGQPHQQQFRQWYDDLQHPTPELRKIVALEVEACLRRLALSFPESSLSRGVDLSRADQIYPEGDFPAPSSLLKDQTDSDDNSPASPSALRNQIDLEDNSPTILVVPDVSSHLSLPDHAENTTLIAPVSELSPVERIASFIAEHYTEPLPITQIAHEVNLHPNYVMSLFRKNYAISIVDYITQYRIAHAQRLLVTTDLNVSQIAIESGFGSVSRFYTAFKAACAQSPGEYRALLSIP